MGRVSRAQAQDNRRRIVETASRLFREQGTQVSVADLMKAAGLTHGGFYKQFASKEALIDEATAYAFDDLTQRHTAALERDGAQRALIDAYLSVEHRDNPADGCPVAALAGDMAREPGIPEAHRVYAEGVGDFAGRLATDYEVGLVRLCTMLGALLLARATKDSPVSEEILAAARAALATEP
ncbi:TetR/AcrR family transcriptional regulator, transcriptional repressor for nem operon [Nonomuraea solani]|uniref:TetR/AcrR family transcriptional regulator, transcriptional repressor for nem operon n=1 Tax=Nonomuraea solani TaxID=1144553 RepID=A0A1H6F116_9ACTN|nr:TetR family transcriptional regulator [Nonomuraea solani]SEH03837.1 TetR/AcrR family transcriptional regulator, transcriptional repressor for nem operon [Nonomuraea solani]